MKADIFEDLFVLEMANNHLGKLERGLSIVDKFSKIIRFNMVRAAIKIQLRDVNTLIHADYRKREDIRYIKKPCIRPCRWRISRPWFRRFVKPGPFPAPRLLMKHRWIIV